MILVIDDEPAITEMLTDLLELHGHPVMVMNSAQAALDLLPVHRPDVIMVDLMMPSVDGVSLAMALRYNPTLRDVPLIAMSASDSALALADRMGDFDAFLSKPFETQALLNLIERFSKVAS